MINIRKILSIKVIAVILFSNALLFFLINKLNHSISQYSLYFFLNGIYLIFAATNIRLKTGLFCSFITGLFLDSMFPYSFGLSTVCFIPLHFLLYKNRYKLHRDQNWHITLLAFAINLLLIAILFFSNSNGHLFELPYFIHCTTDLVISQILLILSAPWFFDFQRSTMQWVGVDLSIYDLSNT